MVNFKFTIAPVFMFLLSFALFVGGLVPYYLFYIFILVVLIPLIHNIITLIRIDGQVKIPEGSLYTKDEIDIEYRVENNSRLSIPYLEIDSSITRLLTGRKPEKTVLSLRPKSGFTNKERIKLNKRGYYPLGQINVNIRDVFNFYSFQKSITSNASLLVYPEIINLTSLKITANFKSGELLTEKSLYQDHSNINTLRDYRQGDPIKSIHWKLTAKKDSPIVKEYEHRVDTNTMIFLDNESSLFAGDVDRRLEDKSVDVSLSIINYCLNNNMEVVLETQDEDRLIHLEGNQKSDLKPYVEELTRFSANGTMDISSLILAQIDTIKKGSTLIIISPILDKSRASLGVELRLKSINPIFIILTDDENKTGYIDPVIEGRMKEEGIPIYVIDYETSIKGALEVHNG